jgi:hypothetical protein
MKLLTEYLERAVSLERLAACEHDSNFKTQSVKSSSTLSEIGGETAEHYDLAASEPS